MEEATKKEQEETDAASKTFWIVGAVVLVLFGLFAAKILFFPTETYKVTLVDAPKSIQPGSVATFTWRVDGPPASIYHTAVYLGKESLPGELGRETHPADTKYTESLKDFMYGKFNIPLQFIGNVKLDAQGKYFFRVHATVKDKNYWSDEEVMEVK